MQIMNVPFRNITDLKKSPNKLFDEAKAKQTGVYVFNRDQPAGVVLAVTDYEKLVRQNAQLQDQLFEMEQDYVVSQRLLEQAQNGQPVLDDQTVRGVVAATEETSLDEHDGWA